VRVAVFDTLRTFAAGVRRDLARALNPAPAPSPSVADVETASTAPSPRTLRRRGVVDSGDELFAGKFYEPHDWVKGSLEGGWEPRAGYSDVILEMLGRTGLARRIIAMRPLDATREGWGTRFPSMPPSVAEAASARLAAMQTELGVQLAFYLGLVKAEQYGEAVIVMGIDDGQSFDEPINMAAIKRVLWLKIFAEKDYNPGPLSPPTDPNFGLPEYYDFTDFSKPILESLERAQRSVQGQVRVHHSRVLRFNTEEGTSRLDEIGQALEDYFSAMRSGRKAASVFSIAVYKISNWLSKWVKDEESATQRASLQHTAMQKLGAVVLDKETEDFSYQAQPSTGLADLIDRAAAQLSAWTGLPAMLLFGVDPAGFSSGEEVVRRYYDTVRVVQTLQVAPPLRRLLEILMVAENGPAEIVTPPNDWAIVFRPLRVLTAQEQAEIRDLVSRTIIALKDAQIIDRDEGRASLPREGDDVPDVRLSDEAFRDSRERLEVGIVSALIEAVTNYYGGTPPPAPLQTLVAAIVPELADVVSEVFTERTGAPDDLGDDLEGELTEADRLAEQQALDSDPEAWKTADEVRAHFGVSKLTLRRRRNPQRGAHVDVEPGRFRWIAPDGRPKYKLSEVREVFEGAPPTEAELDKPPAPSPQTPATTPTPAPTVDAAALFSGDETPLGKRLERAFADWLRGPATTTDPYPTEHTARLIEPRRFASFTRKPVPGEPGVAMIIGVRSGGGTEGTEVQAFRFDRTRFTPAQARAWLRRHGRKAIMFEPATT